jgi:hypothetical protein
VRTEELIAALAVNPTPVRPPRLGRRIAHTLLAGGLIAAGLLALSLGVRADLLSAALPVLGKAAFCLSAPALLAPLLPSLFTPGRPLDPRPGAALALVALASLAASCTALFGVDPSERWRIWTAGAFPWCVALIPAFAAPSAAGLIWLARTLAPPRPRLTGAAIGATAGGVGGLVYALCCSIDSIPFVLTWYGVGIGAAAALGAAAGDRLLRW